MNNTDLWRLSASIHKESFFQAQIKSVGIQKNKFLERYQKNIANSKRSNLYISLLSSLFLLIYAAFPIIGLISISRSSVTELIINDKIFSLAFIFATYYIINFVYYFLIGFLAMMEFLTGKTFKYLRTLPFNSSDIRKLIIFTVIRMNGIQIMVIIFTVPVAILLLLKNLPLVVILFLINIINALFMFYFFIVLSDFLSRKVFNNTKSSKLYTLIRIFVSMFYLISMLSISYVTQFIPFLSQSEIISKTFGANQTIYVNLISSLVIFPITSGYLICLVVFPISLIPIQLIITTLFAFTFFCLVIFKLLTKGNKILSNLTLEDIKTTYNEKRREIVPEKVKVRVSSTKTAYIKRVFIMATREQGKLIVFLLPIIFPIITAFSIRSNSANSSINLDPFIGLIILFTFIPYIINNGLIEAEEGLGGLLSTLPIKNRDIFRAKQILMTGLLLVTFFVYILIIGYSNVFQYTESVIKILFLTIMLPGTELLFFSILYGKINRNYTLFKVNNDNTFIKYVILFSSQIMVILIIVGGFNLLYSLWRIQNMSFLVFLIFGNIIFLLTFEFFTRIIIRA